MEAWRSAFGFEIGVNHVQMLDTYMKDDQMSESLILEAIERVKQAVKPGLNYLWKILSNGASLGIQSIGFSGARKETCPRQSVCSSQLPSVSRKRYSKRISFTFQPNSNRISIYIKILGR
ncbi:DnaD domain protein [Bacillus sp. V3B]|uniref:DnaD domain-containing protein n=1 Tax=Bacillus sp. V3B TaxID=2804915 RepID=UPI00210E4888|nr:DnaD domain protein [Bacillus sp. V3B]MCQ6274775.1 DnaD domain protein [Bacillus sp. V3B]